MNASVLLVDRDPALTEEVRRLMSHRSQQVKVCCSGVQCLEILKDFAPNVLVIDPEVLWGGGCGVLEWLICNESMIPPMVVIASDQQSPPLPEHLEPWVDLQIRRPKSAEDFLSFVSQLETLAWWSQSPYRDLEPGRRKNSAIAP